jgi:hypothetical protein
LKEESIKKRKESKMRQLAGGGIFPKIRNTRQAAV